MTVSTGDPTVATVSSSSLNFSPPFTATLVTVTAVANDIVNPPGQRSTTITHSASGYPSRTVVVNVIDDEASTEASISEPYVPDNLLPAFADTAMIADIVVEVRQPIAPRLVGGPTRPLRLHPRSARPGFGAAIRSKPRPSPSRLRRRLPSRSPRPWRPSAKAPAR